jgi:ribulose-phosphate 3-epimerase
MSIICPTVTAFSEDEYSEQADRIAPFARRIHLDFMDGEFTPTTSIPIEKAWWPKGVVADIHLMYKRPLEHIETLVSLAPSLVIVHAEAEGDLVGMLQHLQTCGISPGVAILQETPISKVEQLLAVADHALIFSGSLGSFGGKANLALLEKVEQIRTIRPDIEIGWDGGANEENVIRLVLGGVDVVNVGGAVQKAGNPQAAYDRLVAKLTE